MTLTKGQVFTGNLEKKPFLNIFDNISDTIHSRVMRHGPKVAWGGDLKNDMTLGDLDNISDIIHSRVMILGQKVACGEPLLKVKKYLFLTIFDNLSNTVYW